MESISVGTRVSVEGYYGTVKFSGTVKGTQGNWIGVEWDDPSRGKHSGCHNGTQYFKTRHLTGGSFVRPSKADLGMSCPEGIKEKYFSCDEKMKTVQENVDVWLLGNIGNTQSNIKIIEFVGPEKVSSLQRCQELLRIVNLHSMPVSCAGKDISNLAPNITDLDLSHTLISHWDTVAQIAIQLPKLRELKLGMNHLQVPTLVTKHREAFQSVTRMSLEQCGLTWDHLLSLANMWPHVEFLEVSANNITTLSVPPKNIFYNLRALSLQENPINSWLEVCKLGNLPQLHELYLNGARLSHIDFPDSSHPYEATNLFPLLERVEVANNDLQHWKSIGEMNKLKKLVTLRVTCNPVMGAKPDFDTVFNEIISRVGNVTTLNRMEVNEAIRQNAELYYLKKYFPQWLASGGDTCSEKSNPNLEFLTLHPRFKEILDKYGEPAIGVVDDQPKNLKRTLLKLLFISADSPDSPSIEKKVPLTMTVANLKKMANVLFKTNKKAYLSYYPTDERFGDGRPEYSLDNDFRDLAFYELQNGDKVFVRWRRVCYL